MPTTKTKPSARTRVHSTLGSPLAITFIQCLMSGQGTAKEISDATGMVPAQVRNICNIWEKVGIVKRRRDTKTHTWYLNKHITHEAMKKIMTPYTSYPRLDHILAGTSHLPKTKP